MSQHLFFSRILMISAVIALFSCDSDDEAPKLRPSIDYATLDADTAYAKFFVDATGVSTVDLTEGNTLHKMFQALNYHSTSSVSANEEIDADVLKDMFSNTRDPFYDIQTNTISVKGADLNGSNLQLKNVVASSLQGTQAEAVRTKIESDFEAIAAASEFLDSTASQGEAGKLGNYLVDEKGIEIAQIIQKSLIGALQLDYIGNVLLDEGLDADNTKLVDGKNYTQLEHNWDIAYGLLTLNPVYLKGSTDDKRGTTEFGAGSYLWEYNKANYAKIYPSFLKGRTAIVNNDEVEIKGQATFIRTEFEKAIAGAALGYLGKWKSADPTAAGDPARAHAIGEGLGFIYSLRFAEIHGGDAAFSDGIISDLIDSPNGFWDLDAAKINAAEEAIREKFNL